MVEHGHHDMMTACVKFNSNRVCGPVHSRELEFRKIPSSTGSKGVNLVPLVYEYFTLSSTAW